MRRRGPGRNLPIAIGVGVGLGGIVLLSLYTVKEAFLVVVVVFVGIGCTELTRALGARGIQVPLVPMAVGGIAMLVSSYAAGPTGLIAAFGLTVLGVLAWRLPEGVTGYVRDVTAGMFATAYVPFLAGFAVLMLSPADGAERIVLFIVVTICSDIGGFFAGTFFGRHRMAPAISPKKTWEGFTGSALTCIAGGAVLLPVLLDGAVWQGAVLGAAAVCTATLGDLIESMIKRDLGIKDMGALLPEHGGAMDRLDSLLASVPVVWLLLEVFVPPAS